MSVLAVSGRDVYVPRQERSSVATTNFSIDALISQDSPPLIYRRTPFASRPPPPTGMTSHDGVFCGATEASTPPPTPPGLRQLTVPVGCVGQIDLAAMRRLYQLNGLTGKNVVVLPVIVVINTHFVSHFPNCRSALVSSCSL